MSSDAHITKSIIGYFAFDDNKKLLFYKLFKPSPSIIAEKLNKEIDDDFIANLSGYDTKEDDFAKKIMRKKAIEMIDADALALHLNPLQEVCQPEGDTNWGNCLKKIKELCTKLDKPIIVKETGAGISREVAVELKNTGISALDISGSGGTSWSLVENYRNDNGMETFNNWGIPTAVSLIEVVNSVKIPVIASGGIRNGIDIAKALCLGADIVGMALPFLKPATKSGKEVKKLLKKLTIELKTTMFLVGAKNIDELRKKPVVITGKTKEWLESRGVDIKKFSARK